MICAWREGIWPWPACSTWPMTTCSTCSGSTPARSSAALIASAAELGRVQRGQAAAHLADGGARGCRGSRSLAWKRVSSCRSLDGTESKNGSGPLRARRRRAAPRSAHGRPLSARRAYGRISCRRMQISRDDRAPAHDRRGHGRGRRVRRRAAPAGAPAELGELLASGEARRAFKSLALTHAEGKRWLLVGLGARDELRRRARARGGGGGRARARASFRTRTLCWQLPPRASARRSRRRSSRARSSATTASSATSRDARTRRCRAPPKQLERLIVSGAGGPRRGGRRGGAARRGGQPRARPAEPAGQRPHADGARRVRERARREIEDVSVRGRGTRRDRARAAWAPSRRSRRAPSRSRR